MRPALLVAALCLAAAALYVWMRASVAAELRAPFAELCGEVLRPGDWPCRVTRTDFLATFAGGAFLIGLGVALPGVILAMSGRRLSALVPAALAAAGAWAIEVVAVPGGSSQPFGIAESFLGSGDGRAYWQVHAEVAILADLLLVSVPALAIALVLRPPRNPRQADLPRHAVWASTIAIGAAIAGIRLAWPHLPHEQYLAAPFDDVAISMTLMVLFGSMLGTDRRWWPWALVPAAVLLSLGPAAAVMAIPSNLTAFTWFGDALPLLVVGLVASLWRPLATWFARSRVADTPSTTAASGRRPVRPVVVVNALAGALLLAPSSQRASIRSGSRSGRRSRPIPAPASSRKTYGRRPTSSARSTRWTLIRPSTGRTVASMQPPESPPSPSSPGATSRRARSSSYASRRRRRLPRGSSRTAAAAPSSAQRPP